MNDYLLTIFGAGGIIVVAIGFVRELTMWFLQRRAKKKDKEEEEKRKKEEKKEEKILEKIEQLEENDEKTDKQSQKQSEALKFLLYDRIRHLGQCYISEKAVDIDDRRILNDMHRSYHEGLGGNGDLDILMKEVNSLPLKQKGGK